MNEQVRSIVMTVVIVLLTVGVWGVFFAIWGLAGAIILTVLIAMVLGVLWVLAAFREHRRTALPAKILSNGVQCSNCDHSMNIHYLINQTGDPLDGGQMMCTSNSDCDCRVRWRAEIEQVPELITEGEAPW